MSSETFAFKAAATNVRTMARASKGKRDEVEVEKAATASIGIECPLRTSIPKPYHVQPRNPILNGDCNHHNHKLVFIDVGKTRFKVRFTFVVNRVEVLKSNGHRFLRLNGGFWSNLTRPNFAKFWGPGTAFASPRRALSPLPWTKRPIIIGHFLGS